MNRRFLVEVFDTGASVEEQPAHSEPVTPRQLGARLIGDPLADLFQDWVDAATTVIDEFGYGTDYHDLVVEAERRAAMLGLDWDRDRYVPDHVIELLATEEE